MSTAGLLAVAAVALTASLLAGAPRVRLTDPPDAAPAAGGDEVAPVLRLRPVLVACAFLGGWLFVGSTTGLLAGVAAGAVAWRLLGQAESPTVRRRREQLLRDLPLAADLLASCLREGAALEGSLETVADAVGGPLADRFRNVHHQLTLGVDPVSVWEEVARDPLLAPMGRAVARSYESGASVLDAVEGLSADLREQARTEAQVRANGVEVRAAAPLGVCFLPAFLLIGVVPLVAGAVAKMSLFG